MICWLFGHKYGDWYTLLWDSCFGTVYARRCQRCFHIELRDDEDDKNE